MQKLNAFNADRTPKTDNAFSQLGTLPEIIKTMKMIKELGANMTKSVQKDAGDQKAQKSDQGPSPLTPPEYAYKQTTRTDFYERHESIKRNLGGKYDHRV